MSILNEKFFYTPNSEEALDGLYLNQKNLDQPTVELKKLLSLRYFQTVYNCIVTRVEMAAPFQRNVL